MLPDLPIQEILPELSRALALHATGLLHAPPGAGKSTVVPLALLELQEAAGGKIIMLEPRRLAARAVASRMAQSIGEELGGTVGLRTRLETRVSARTRIEVMTEGVLTRMLQADASLADARILIFDEFHERNLNSDLGLALAIESQRALRPDLKILIMSATLELAPLAQLLQDAPLISATGRPFPVTVHYAPVLADRSLEQHMAKVIRTALAAHPGDLLAFLPGAAEIHRVQRALDGHLDRTVDVLPLYGELPAQQQDAALAPTSVARRKVVLATSIAETSITFPGVSIVVDSGLSRTSMFDPASGMSRLHTEKISKAAAEQRAGRAGRTAPGVCYRLWSEGSHARLISHTPPEILRADLAPLALELAVWGVRDAESLSWLNAPAAAPLAQAREVLRGIGALRGELVTDHGRLLASYGLHPRLAHLLEHARREHCLELGSLIAALLSERDILRGVSNERDVDLRTRVEIMRDGTAPGPLQLNESAVAHVKRSAGRFAHSRSHRDSAPSAHPAPPLARLCGELVARAYPDRVARRRERAGHFLLRNGKGARLPAGDALAREEFLAVAEIEAGAPEAIIRIASPIDRAALERIFAQEVQTIVRIDWCEREHAVIAQSERRLGAIILDSVALDAKESPEIIAAVLDGIRREGIAALPWTPPLRQWQARVELLRRLLGEAWPHVTDAALLASLEQWAPPWLAGITRASQFARIDLSAALRSMLTFEQSAELERHAPTHLEVPSGSRIAIDYTGDDAPSISVRLQEMFGCSSTPTVARGRTPLLMKLLSPAHRPVQLTRDLQSFWSRGYHDVKKDLKGRYPKHFWPEDPLRAAATRTPARRVKN